MNIIPEDLHAYDVTVDEPEHIPALVQLTQDLGSYTPVIIGLDHQEDEHAMRGRYEEFGDLEPGEEVFRRPDGGHTVYTDDSKYALTFGLPMQPTDTKRANTYTDNLHDFINERTDTELQEGQRDLYLGGDQLIGVSQRLTDESTVLRGYWAEEIPEVYDLMYQDGLSEEDINAHQRAMRKSADVLGEQEFYQQIMDEFDARNVSSTDLLEDHFDSPEQVAGELLEEEGVRERKVCFLERP